MKPRLLHREGELDGDAPPPGHAADLIRDLGLDEILSVMAGGDAFLRDVAQQVLVASLTDPAAIAYRQDALRDCLDNRAEVQELYDLALEAITSEEAVYPGLGRSASSSLHHSIQLIEAMLGALRRLRHLADERSGGFRSEAFAQLVDTIDRELDDAFFATATDQLERLRFPAGVVVGARLGRGGRGTRYVLREPPLQQGWARRVVASVPTGASVEVSGRDRSAARALAELRERGLERIAWSLERSSQHLYGFFEVLRREVGFYLGCVRLYDELARRGSVAFPEVAAEDDTAFDATGLYDAGLSLRIDDRVVGNDVAADGKPLVLITGANQGGKSTFLRSVGLAQLMMQAGMFVAAERLRAHPTAQLFTHFRRGEDRAMESGKLDEELGRLSGIVDRLAPGGTVLFNESFASTNEHEGAQIAQDVVRALLESGVRVFFVTHGYDLAATIAELYPDDGLFLRAERHEGGARTYRLLVGTPEPTSYGRDLYDDIFGR